MIHIKVINLKTVALILNFQGQLKKHLATEANKTNSCSAA